MLDGDGFQFPFSLQKGTPAKLSDKAMKNSFRMMAKISTNLVDRWEGFRRDFYCHDLINIHTPVNVPLGTTKYNHITTDLFSVVPPLLDWTRVAGQWSLNATGEGDIDEVVQQVPTYREHLSSARSRLRQLCSEILEETDDVSRLSEFFEFLATQEDRMCKITVTSATQAVTSMATELEELSANKAINVRDVVDKSSADIDFTSAPMLDSLKPMFKSAEAARLAELIQTQELLGQHLETLLGSISDEDDSKEDNTGVDDVSSWKTLRKAFDDLTIMPDAAMTTMADLLLTEAAVKPITKKTDAAAKAAKRATLVNNSKLYLADKGWVASPKVAILADRVCSEGSA